MAMLDGPDVRTVETTLGGVRVRDTGGAGRPRGRERAGSGASSGAAGFARGPRFLTRPEGGIVKRDGMHERLYAANATVLLAHQVDAAYWHEWTMFGMSGGIQLFVLLNVPIILLVLAGVRALASGHPSGRALSLVLAGAGGFAAVFHGIHLVLGRGEFTLPVSLALLGATALLSPAQLWVALRTGPRARTAAGHAPA